MCRHSVFFTFIFIKPKSQSFDKKEWSDKFEIVKNLRLLLYLQTEQFLINKKKIYFSIFVFYFGVYNFLRTIKRIRSMFKIQDNFIVYINATMYRQIKIRINYCSNIHATFNNEYCIP